MKNLANFDAIPSILNEPIFERAFASAEIAKFNKDDQLRYEANLKIYRDSFAVLSTKWEEGKAEEKLEIAGNLKKMGLDPETISRATGLSLEEIGKVE